MKERLWEFKYAPTKWEDLIINDDLKPILKKNLDERPNMLLYGSPGVGKGSYVDVLMSHNDLKSSTMKINASLEGGIETIRSKVLPFAQASNFELDKLKLVYLNEVDHPNLAVSQGSLRQLMEDVQKTTQFVLVCNYIENIIPELKSRCQVYQVGNPPAKEIYSKCEYILNNENIKFNKKSLIQLVKKCYPDIRSTIISLRQNVINGKLSDNIIISSSDTLFADILSAMLSGDPEQVRKKLKSNTIFYPQLYEYLYKQIMESENSVFKNDAEAILLIGEHHYRDSMVAIKEINFMHMIFQMLKKGCI